MTEWRWLLVCTAAGAVAAVLLYWATGQPHLPHRRPATVWVTPAQPPQHAATIGN
jgi:hypothetical protein